MPAMLSADQRVTKIDRLRRFPDELEALAKPLSEAELYTVFIPGEWSVAQIIHHLPDSHLNAYVRTRLILTERMPPLKSFDHDAWAELADYKMPIEPSLMLLRGLHMRWCTLLDSLRESDFIRIGVHSVMGEMSIDNILILYASLCDGHMEQITRTLAAK